MLPSIVAPARARQLGARLWIGAAIACAAVSCGWEVLSLGHGDAPAEGRPRIDATLDEADHAPMPESDSPAAEPSAEATPAGDSPSQDALAGDAAHDPLVDADAPPLETGPDSPGDSDAPDSPPLGPAWACVADIDHDGDVDATDVGLLVGYLYCDAAQSDGGCASFDLTGDGKVDDRDRDLVQALVGASCPDGWSPPAGWRCAADANGDGVVDPTDIGFVMARFGCAPGTGDAACDAADVTRDGVVDDRDAKVVSALSGTHCS
jgi:hypothetical protein